MKDARCPLGDECDFTLAWMMGAERAKDTIKAQAAEIEKLRQNIRAEALDMLHGTPCAQIRWQQERETLQAEIEIQRKRVAELEGQHKALLLTNAILRQRPDLPLNRIPAARAMAKLYEENAKLREDIKCAMVDGYDSAKDDYRELVNKQDEEVTKLRAALVIWRDAYQTGRNEPLVAAYEHGEAALSPA